MIDNLPLALKEAHSALQTLEKQFYKNINYYIQVSLPLTSQQSTYNQLESLQKMKANFTELIGSLEEGKNQFATMEQDVNTQAEEHFQATDKYITMSDEEKNKLFEQSTGQMKQSVKLLMGKFSKIKEKIDKITLFSASFHKTVLRLEELYRRDI